MRDSFLDPPKWKQNRLRGYDYGRPGYYFITICANQRAEFFWDMVAENLAVKLGSCVGRAEVVAPYSVDSPDYCRDETIFQSGGRI